MKCPDPSLISAYHDGELDELWSSRLTSHMEECSGCRNRLGAFRTQSEWLRSGSYPSFDGREELWRQVRRRTRLYGNEPIWRRKVALPLPVLATAAALMLALMSWGVLAGRFRKPLPVLEQPRTTLITLTLPAESIDQFFLVMESLDSDGFRRDAALSLPGEIDLALLGDPRFLLPIDLEGEETP